MKIKRFSKEIQAEAIAKVKDGMKLKDVAKNFKTTPASIRSWVKKADNGNRNNLKAVANKWNNLKKKIESLETENDVLLKIINRLS